MPSTTIAVCKFVGTIGLGLLTGLSASLSTLTLPSLLMLPTALAARSTLTYLTTRTKTYTHWLRHLTAFSLCSAFFLSPHRARHPYLMYTALLAVLSGPGVDFAIASTTKEGSWSTLTTGISEFDVEREEDVNGEQVRQAVEGMRFVEGIRAGVAGVAFAMGVIGIWGDGS